MKNLTVKWMVVAMSVVLLIGCVLGGTLAWLLDQTAEIENTFTTSDIDIELEETKEDFKMIPGCTIAKDPTVTVLKDSEACYVFIKVEESENLDNYIDYAIHNQWKPLDGVAGVYYITIDTAVTADVDYKILVAGSKEYGGVTYTWGDDQVLVKPTVDKTAMTTASTNQPTLSFTAYAVQLNKGDNGQFTAAEAWATVSATANP